MAVVDEGITTGAEEVAVEGEEMVAAWTEDVLGKCRTTLWTV